MIWGAGAAFYSQLLLFFNPLRARGHPLLGIIKRLSLAYNYGTGAYVAYVASGNAGLEPGSIPPGVASYYKPGSSRQTMKHVQF